MDYDKTREVLAAFEREGVRYVIIGAEDLNSERIDFDGLQVTVVTPETLYRMKKATVRLRDKGDAERLRQRFGLEEE